MNRLIEGVLVPCPVCGQDFEAGVRSLVYDAEWPNELPSIRVHLIGAHRCPPRPKETS